MNIQQAYKVCGGIARREAKNFYYAFLALPEAKRNAMYAIYAFMRRADDISDDETQTLDDRRNTMQAWINAWHATQSGGESNDAVFTAVRDAQRRFAISNALLEQLVQGVAMDLNPNAGAQTYKTFDELYHYCYLVASVVGLVCIRVFGYTDTSAEKLAEETGIAFQLTNILRDVKEDAERGRIYLPLEDLQKFGVSEEDVLTVKSGAAMSVGLHNLLQMESERALKYYESAEKLLPMIDADSRPALWVLVNIYRGLLLKIIDAKFDVFSERVSVPAWKKSAILLRGMASMLLRGGR